MNDNRQYSGAPQDEPIRTEDWKALFPKDHLTSTDFIDPITGNYKDWNLTITAVVNHEVYDQQERKKIKKPIIRFKGAEKYMFLNVEIGTALQKITGQKDPQKWIGKLVNAYVFRDRQTPQGKMDVPRLRPVAGAVAQNSVPPDEPPMFQTGTNDDIPF